MKKETALVIIKLVSALSLLTGIITLIFIIFLSINPQKNPPSSQPIPTITTPLTPLPTATTCGFYTPKCPTGYTCSIPNTGKNGGINPQGTCIKEQTVVCTMEAKLCPDGSSVGRTGPKCEFAACPGE